MYNCSRSLEDSVVAGDKGSHVRTFIYLLFWTEMVGEVPHLEHFSHWVKTLDVSVEPLVNI